MVEVCLEYNAEINTNKKAPNLTNGAFDNTFKKNEISLKSSKEIVKC